MAEQVQAKKVTALTVADRVGLAFDAGKEEIQKVAVKGFDFERVKRIAVSAVRRDPKLQACDPATVFQAAIDAVKLGFEPGGPLGHAYLIPYGTKCQLITGFRGYIALVRRSGEVRSLEAHIIYANDVFDVDFGRENPIIHKPNLLTDRGAPLAAYALARLVGGGVQCDVMPVAEIDKIMLASPSRGEYGPWKDHRDEMRRKTVIRRICKTLPMTIELAEEFEREDRLDYPERDVTEKPRKALHALPPSMPAESFASEGAAQEFAAINAADQHATVAPAFDAKPDAPVVEAKPEAPPASSPEADMIAERIAAMESADEYQDIATDLTTAKNRTTNPMPKSVYDALSRALVDRKKAVKGGAK